MQPPPNPEDSDKSDTTCRQSYTALLRLATLSVGSCQIRDNRGAMSEDRTVTAVHIERPIALGRLELFASGPNDPRARRPIDWIRSVVSLMFLVVFAVLSDIGSDLDAA